jgi:hypothetical protein
MAEDYFQERLNELLRVYKNRINEAVEIGRKIDNSEFDSEKNQSLDNLFERNMKMCQSINKNIEQTIEMMAHRKKLYEIQAAWGKIDEDPEKREEEDN